MSTAFDVLFILGVIANLLNLGDFLLRPSQKESFQRQMESVVLWLDYTQPVTWLRRLGNMPTYVLCLISLFSASIGCGLMNSAYPPNFGRILGLFIFIYSLIIVILFRFWKYANIVFDYIIADGKIKTFYLDLLNYYLYSTQYIYFYFGFMTSLRKVIISG